MYTVKRLFQTTAFILGITLPFSLLSCKADDNLNANDSSDSIQDSTQEAALAFPGAEGFGRHTSGGRGGRVFYVTKLTDDGSPGTLRYAVKQTMARYILFKVSGTIALQSRLNIDYGNVTIAGQTAPGEGICIKNYPVQINADNIIIRFIRFRMGDEKKVQGDALGGRFYKDIMIDHCSASWSTDECLSFYFNTNTTVQWCMITESLRNSAHSKGSHGYGGIFGGTNASFHHNLLACHDSRNPRFGDLAKVATLSDLVDYRNNVIYNWGGNSAYGGEGMNINIVNNYYKPGPATKDDVKSRIYSIDMNQNPEDATFNTWGKYYIDGNVIEGQPKPTNNNWEFGVYNQFGSWYHVTAEDKAGMRLSSPHPINNNVTTQTAEKTYESVLNYAGASLKRDPVDERIIDNVRKGTFTADGSEGSKNGIIDSQKDVGGWPTLESIPAPKDSDDDGMPNNWESDHQLDPNTSNSNGKDLSTVYDNVEVYLHSLVKEITLRQLK